jgi:hypothetical protein
MVPEDSDRFIGEAEPPFRRLLLIATGPKHTAKQQVV